MAFLALKPLVQVSSLPASIAVCSTGKLRANQLCVDSVQDEQAYLKVKPRWMGSLDAGAWVPISVKNASTESAM